MAKDRLLVWMIVGSQFGPPFMFAGVAVAIPPMSADLGAGATSQSLVEALFLAGGLSFLLPAGRLADATDKRLLYKLGLLTFGVTSILIGLLSSVPLLLALRFLQGISSAVFAATGPAILADIVPPERRGRVFGASLGVIYAGLTLGPFIAGMLIDLWGWRSVFLLGAAVILVGCALLHRMMRGAWRSPGDAVNVPSVGLVVSAVLCFVGGSATLHHGPGGYVGLAAGLVLAMAFVRLQRRLERPLVDVSALVQNRILRNALLVQMLLYMNAACSIFMLSVYMQVSLGHDTAQAGRVLAIGSVLMACMAPVAGSLADRYPPRVISTCGVGCVLVSAILAASLGQQSSLTYAAVILAVQGLGFALFSSPNMTVIMGSMASHSASMASALGAKARSLGMASGMLLTTILISLEIGNDPVNRHPVHFIGIMVTAFAILAGLTAVALVASILSRGRR